jgi:phage terminase Nu1 subunit (DNA packaging protein)
MPLIRKSEFAKIKGVSGAAVSQAIKSGRIRGAVVTQNGKELLDHDLALELWERNTLQQPPPTNARKDPPTDKQLREFIDGLPEDQIPDLNESRARREHYQAEKAKLEALQGRGELVPAEEVKREAFAMGRQIRDALQGIPDRVASLLAASSDVREVHRMLTEEIRVALRGLADG